MTHYFSPEDHPTSQARSFTVRLGDRAFQATTDSGVFSTSKLDPGTKALLDVVPSPPGTGTFLDLGCGWGPLSMALAAASPTARVVGVDVNPRAVELTNANLKANKLTNARAHTVEDLLSSEPGFEFE
ncbi:MAG TPA: methyltransferase, partial [Beutenbergiaceae bacterium]|nr:methyltransferase [Beutenbergiaceae bacterium]